MQTVVVRVSILVLAGVGLASMVEYRIMRRLDGVQAGVMPDSIVEPISGLWWVVLMNSN